MSLIEKINQNLLEVVTANFEYFRSRPVHLAWAMRFYEVLVRLDKNNGDYKDMVISSGDKLPSEEDGKLLYDAWGHSLHHDFFDTNPNWPLNLKPNKTLDDWIELLPDKRHRWHLIYSTPFSVKNHLLCVTGNGYGWNSHGFIAEMPGETDSIIFSGYTRAEGKIRADIKEKIRNCFSNSNLKSGVEEYLKGVESNANRIYAGEDWDAVLDPRFFELRELSAELKKELKKKKPEIIKYGYSSISHYSGLSTMPSNAHESYIHAGEEIAKNIISDKEQHKGSRALAQKFLKKFM